MKPIYTILLALLFVSCISVKADVTTEQTKQTTTSPSEAEAAIRLVMEAQGYFPSAFKSVLITSTATQWWSGGNQLAR